MTTATALSSGHSRIANPLGKRDFQRLPVARLELIVRHRAHDRARQLPHRVEQFQRVMRLRPLHQSNQGVARNPPHRVALALDAPRSTTFGVKPPDRRPAVLVGLPQAQEEKELAAFAEARGDLDDGGRADALDPFEESAPAL